MLFMAHASYESKEKYSNLYIHKTKISARFTYTCNKTVKSQCVTLATAVIPSAIPKKKLFILCAATRVVDIKLNYN
jgi:hypothetical protein